MSLGFLWDSYGGFHDGSVIFLWDCYGMSEGILWEFNRIHMGFLWDFVVFPLLFPCYTYDLSMRFLWDSYGISMINQLSINSN